MVIETIVAFGHPNIRATHETTFEVTKESHLTLRGDCIIAVRASKGASDLDQRFKNIAKRPNSKITVVIQAGEFKETVIGSGNPQLSFKHPTDLVARKSDFVSNRTLMIHSNKAACDFSRRFITVLRNPAQEVKVILKAEINE